MRKGFTVSLIATLLFGGGYFYYIAQAVCPVPLTYSISTIDDRFGLSADDARLALSEAESVWEDATGKNLFTYIEDGGELAINFVYDERQKFVEAESEFTEKLDATENISEAISTTYAELVEEYNELRSTYADKAEAYERKLGVYNAEVEKYNNEGGAPPEVYESLAQQKQSLNSEQTELNTLASTLNELVAEINSIGEKGNTLINSYNKGVNEYNETFTESHEFTQGDYSNSTITIYTFEDKAELRLVLAHELGHALSLGHVEGGESVMHYLIGEQPEDTTLSAPDIVEFNRVCGDISLWEKVQLSFQR